MRVSTRTPEGEPLECRICGHRTFVLLSDPPRDSVCPNCGCFAWIAQTVLEPISDIPLEASTIATVVVNIGRCENTASVAAKLDSGLREILRPDAIVIWGLNGNYANEMRLTPLSQHGGMGNETFAREIVRMNRSLAHRKGNLAPFRFKFGLPWLGRSRNRSIGAVELSYVRDVTEDTEMIIARVAESLAVVAASKIRL